MTDVCIAKRRAIAARLLALLFPLAFAFGVPITSAASAPVAPWLLVTDPVSSQAEPASITSPSVFGEAEPEEGIIRESFPLALDSGLGPVTSSVVKPTTHPNYEIRIFSSPECLVGSMVAQGTAEALEEVGIPVPVEADAMTTLSAIQVDPSNPSELSGCSNALSYWEGNVPAGPPGGAGGGGETPGGESGGENAPTSGPSPSNGTSSSTTTSSSSAGSSSNAAVGGNTPAGPKPSPPNLRLTPSARANDMTPLVAGSAPGAEAVVIYDSPNCSGAPVARGPASQLPSGFEVPVAKNSATTFSAIAVAAQHSGCSEAVTYTEDSTAPRTRITMGPGVKTRKHKAVFRFQDITEDPPGTTFACKVDKAKWKPCRSPFDVKHLKPRHYVVAIRATDLAGNVERKPVKRRFIVVPTLGR
jgi:hypothetical protein